MSEDRRWLREYGEGGSRAALEELIGRHLGLVYSSALRQVRDAHLAEDVTQAVFLVLTQKGRTIRRGEAVGGWLLAVTRAVSVNAMKKRAVQKKHEFQAARPEATQAVDDQWEHIAPFLDRVLNRLADKDRDAIVLRFFQGRSFAEIGVELGLSEEAAPKRVGRALERMRMRLDHPRHPLTAGALGVAIGGHAVQAPPMHLLAGTIAASLGGHTPLSASLAKGAIKMIVWTKAKLVGAMAVSILAASVGAVAVTHALTPPPDAGPVATTREKTPTPAAAGDG